MRTKFVHSSPVFFRLVKTALLLLVLLLLAAAPFVQAPLQEAADPGRVPNPVKSAWFLLWIQEVVSYSAWFIYPLLLLAFLFIVLPWLPGIQAPERARWFPKGVRMVAVASCAVFLAILMLTFVAISFRGENWTFVFPF